MVLSFALAFALAYSQAPLYTSNQNQYFLHGAARAGLGFLSEDWLANTADPVPVFSLLVEWTYRLLPLWAFYGYQGLLAMVYFLTLAHLAWHEEERASPIARALFILLLIGLHSAALRFVLARALGARWEYLFDGGVAGQRLLGPVFQPSVFGVLLLVSMWLHSRKKPWLAAALASLAATIHPTYLLTAALLICGYMLDLWRRTRRPGHAFGPGLFALSLALPIVLYVWFRLGPTGPDLSRQAQQILVEVRIPHHTLVRQWFDLSTIVKLAWLVLGLLLARRHRIFPVLAWLFGSTLALTLLQFATGSYTLALLFPWRPSALLVPIATALIAARAAKFAAPRLQVSFPRLALRTPALSALIVLACAAAGVARFGLELEQQRRDPASSMLAFVKLHRAAGQLYLIPPRLQEFRLATGVPALVDFKSIPYRDVDVLEWHQRLRLAQWFYRDRVEEVECGLLQRARSEYGVTHVVLDQDLLSLQCPGLREIYRDPFFVVARLEN